MSDGAFQVSEDAHRRSSLFTLLAQQRRFVYLAVALLSLSGIWAAFALPSAIYPELQFYRITVVAEGSSLAARQQLFSVTRPIEEAVSIVPGVLRVQSRSIRAGSEVNIVFSPGTDMVDALQQVRARISQLQAELPAGLDVVVERQVPSLFPILSYNLEGGDPATLFDIARYQVKPVFSRVPGVGRVDVFGQDMREVEVVADPGKLAAQGMTYQDLANAISAATTVTAVGRLPANYKQYLIVSANEAHAVEDIRNVVIGRGLRVRDVANVVEGTEDHTRIISGDGKPVAQINITRQVGGNTLALADSVESLARSLAASLPPNVRLTPVYDQALLVRDAVHSVRDAMIIGSLLAVLILLLFLRHARITAISASSIPLTISITILVMYLTGRTFNLMTLGALAIAIGLVIDDAVVITENIVRHLHLNANRGEAVRLAVQELVWPVTTSTITTVVVFVPLGLLEGVVGQFFQALSITLTIAVLVSLVLALTIIPLLSEQYLSAADAELVTGERRVPKGALARFGSMMDGVSDRYVRSLASVMRHAGATTVVILVLAVGGWFAYRAVETGFMPEMDEGAFVLDYFTPGGTALSETDRQLRVVDGILASKPEVLATSRRTGAELGLFATEQNTGDYVVRLKPERSRERSAAEVIEDVRGEIETQLPRLRVEFVQILSDVINDLAGSAHPVEVKLFGSDLVALERYAIHLDSAMSAVDGLEDLYSGVSEPAAEMDMVVNAAEVNRAGSTTAAVNEAVSGALLGVSAGEIRLDDRSIPVRVRAPDSVRFDPAMLQSLPVLVTGEHGGVPLGSIASFTPVESRAELLRENQQQMIMLTADLGSRDLGAVMNDVRAVLAANPAPAGVRAELGGQYAGQRDAFRALLLVLALAAASVVGVMVIQFQSFVEPLVVLLAAPLSFVGALVLLLLTGTALNVSSFMGLILLVGLVVKNGIILLDFTRLRMRVGGLPLENALREAARIRLRPILMTTMCTLFGLLPLALGLGSGSELQRPLALAVIGGLALSTPITLYIVPILLVAIRGRGYTIARARA